MSAVPLSEVIAALRDASSSAFYDDYTELADRIEQHGIAPPDGRTPVAWAIDTPHGRGYSFAEELLDSYPIPDGMVLVPKEATRKMLDAAQQVEEDGYFAMWDAMLAAAREEVDVRSEPK